MDNRQLLKITSGQGFIAALDQSGGSTPKALKLYGIAESEYNNASEMFDLIHEMRTRIIKSSAFNSGRVLGAILCKDTMLKEIDNLPTAIYLWEKLQMSDVEQEDSAKARLSTVSLASLTEVTQTTL